MHSRCSINIHCCPRAAFPGDFTGHTKREHQGSSRTLQGGAHVSRKHPRSSWAPAGVLSHPALLAGAPGGQSQRERTREAAGKSSSRLGAELGRNATAMNHGASQLQSLTHHTPGEDRVYFTLLVKHSAPPSTAQGFSRARRELSPPHPCPTFPAFPPLHTLKDTRTLEPRP